MKTGSQCQGIRNIGSSVLFRKCCLPSVNKCVFLSEKKASMPLFGLFACFSCQIKSETNAWQVWQVHQCPVWEKKWRKVTHPEWRKGYRTSKSPLFGCLCLKMKCSWGKKMLQVRTLEHRKRCKCHLKAQRATRGASPCCHFHICQGQTWLCTAFCQKTFPATEKQN